MSINLQEFLDGYKKSEIELGDKKRVFREPKIKDTKLSVLQILEKYCIEGDYKEFESLLDELPAAKHREFIEKLLEELGLA